MLRNKLFSFLNIAGLAFGLACTILLYLWIIDEVNYNGHHEKVDRIFLVQHWQHYNDYEFACKVGPSPLANAFEEQYPEVESCVRFQNNYAKSIAYKDKKFIQKVSFADPALLDIFTVNFILGNKKNFQKEINSIIISEKISKQYFGNENPIGKTLVLDNKLSFTVAGVFENFPKNMTHPFNILVHFKRIANLLPYASDNNWYNNWCWTIALLKEGVDYKKFGQKVIGFLDEKRNNKEDQKNELFLNPFTKIRLYEPKGGGKIQVVKLFGLIAIFILLIACFNYTNLSTARAENRAKEIAVRKALGASRKKLIRQFLSESFIFTFLALNFSLIVVQLLLPAFNNMANKELYVDYWNPTITLSLVAIWLFTSFVAGIYPAFVLSGFKVTRTLKGSKGNSSQGNLFRKVLVIIQFTLSIILIVCSLGINKQIKFLKDYDLGFDKNNMLYIKMQGKANSRYDIIKSELINNANIVDVTKTSQWSPVSVGSNGGGWEWKGKDPDEDVLVTNLTVDEDYLKTFKIKLLEGRFFSSEFPSDTIGREGNMHNIVINKKFADIIGKENITNEMLKGWGDDKFQIIGVVDDFCHLPANQENMPLIIFHKNQTYKNIFIRISGNNIPKTIQFIESVFNKYNPGYIFEVGFLDEAYKNTYRFEDRFSQIIRSFTIFAIIISCLGLFGLTAFAAQKRTKEIGIRKTLGASVYKILFMLSKDISRWILIANIIAWPLAYYFLNKWLSDFPYRWKIDISIFIIAGLSAFALTLITVIYQSLLAAKQNPVESLRYE